VEAPARARIMGYARKKAREDSDIVESGVGGLDEVLGGGFTANRLYLLEGAPGSGKTTLALQFLLTGAKRGETCLFVTLSESEVELRASAKAHGWTLEGVQILEIIASEESLRPDARYTMYHPSEVELGETLKKVLAETERLKPSRLVFDSLSELRLLAENPLRYRRQILALKQHFTRQQCTLIFIDDMTGDQKDAHLHSLAHGVITLESAMREYGTMRRRLQVKKQRGRAFREGYHDLVIRRGGVVAFPRLIAAEHEGSHEREMSQSGVGGLDALLGGGLTNGTSTLILGAAGTGKSSIAAQFVCAAAERGDRPHYFLFDESTSTFLTRSAALEMPVESLRREGKVTLQQIDPAEFSPGEFSHLVRLAVEDNGCRMVVIDTLSGYLNAMPNEHFLTLHLHELLTYLGQQGVTTLLLLTQMGLVGPSLEVPVDASYLADAVVFLRYFEVQGELRQALSVIKKRTGTHERSVREFRIGANGIVVGEPLRAFQGVLSGSVVALPEIPRR
jgi:circadian clock protein KaiC